MSTGGRLAPPGGTGATAIHRATPISYADLTAHRPPYAALPASHPPPEGAALTPPGDRHARPPRPRLAPLAPRLAPRDPGRHRRARPAGPPPPRGRAPRRPRALPVRVGQGVPRPA